MTYNNVVLVGKDVLVAKCNDGANGRDALFGKVTALRSYGATRVVSEAGKRREKARQRTPIKLLHFVLGLELGHDSTSDDNAGHD